ncbi:hypothetical protein CRG98_015695 [Punica granatum]|uniref:Uncharacterized protein n=1 Tax=Punica granatum TaxID=22663 RepID=A0A2I0K5U8_PUNGR|nr:hypothetical protein CRG98_015695 [Punica granatum]
MVRSRYDGDGGCGRKRKHRERVRARDEGAEDGELLVTVEKGRGIRGKKGGERDLEMAIRYLEKVVRDFLRRLWCVLRMKMESEMRRCVERRKERDEGDGLMVISQKRKRGKVIGTESERGLSKGRRQRKIKDGDGALGSRYDGGEVMTMM